MAKSTVARLRPAPKPRTHTLREVCEKHHRIDYADEFAEVRRRLRVVRLALGGGELLADLEGMEPRVADASADARAVRDLLTEIEGSMEAFMDERDRCAVCSPRVA